MLKKISPAIKFLLIMIAIYLMGWFLNPDYFLTAFLNTAKMIYRIIPILVLVFVMQIGINYWVNSGKLKKILKQDNGLKGWLAIIIASILIGGPPYILYPLLGELKEQGMSDTHLATFLYNRNVKIPFLPISIFYFGVIYTLIISILIIIGSVANGLVVSKLTHKN